MSRDTSLRMHLIPTLVPSQIVILDNLLVYKQASLRRIIEAAGCRVALLTHVLSRLQSH